LIIARFPNPALQNVCHGTQRDVHTGRDTSSTLPVFRPTPNLLHQICRQHVPGRISGLFCVGGPTAILFIVTKVVIDAIDRETERFFTHIREKVFKQVPVRTYRDTTTTVVGISGISLIITTATHAFPSVIGQRGIRPGTMSVLRLCRPAYVNTITTAGFYMATRQPTGGYYAEIPAVAQAAPHTWFLPSSLVAGERHNGQPGEFSTRQINRFTHYVDQPLVSRFRDSLLAGHLPVKVKR
jgi:hypothetical protein